MSDKGIPQEHIYVKRSQSHHINSVAFRTFEEAVSYLERVVLEGHYDSYELSPDAFVDDRWEYTLQKGQKVDEGMIETVELSNGFDDYVPMEQPEYNEETGLRSGKGTGLFSRLLLGDSNE